MATNKTRITIVNGCATISEDDRIIAQYRIAYSRRGDPSVIGGHWTPDRPTHRSDVKWGSMPPEGASEYHTIPTETVADMASLPVRAVEATETAARLLAQSHCIEDAARIEQGRRDWAAMSPEQRDAMNDYALHTEGHTID
jgi:hypothetical protein